MAKKRALISVWNKTGIDKFARDLVKLGWEIVSSGGTAKVLRQAGIPVIPINRVTGNPEAFDGRMKTISFAVESALLFDRNNSKHVRQAKKLGIVPIDLVVCNLYPFEEVIAKKGCTLKEAIENIDIGGPTMIRAAAKNFAGGVTVVIDPKDYSMVLEHLKEGEVPSEVRRELAIKVFTRMAGYDGAIDEYLAKEIRKEPAMRIHLTKGKKLRYGENPHQKGWFYEVPAWAKGDSLAIQKFKQIQGKQLSFNNILDIHGALCAISHYGGKYPVCVVIKHSNPCGLAIRDNTLDAYMEAWYLGDPLAAFGSIIAVNRPVNYDLAWQMLADRKFFEVLLAPSVEVDALELFQTKKNLRVLINPALKTPYLHKGLDFKKVRGGMLVQEIDTHEVKARDLKIVTKVKPTKKQIDELLFAWKITKISKSNAVVITKDHTLISSGVGQQDRKRCCELCVVKAGPRAKGAVASSDAFFPFPDGTEVLIDAVIGAIIQPGGSIRDKKSIELCDKRGIAMVFTSKDPKKNMIRCFRH